MKNIVHINNKEITKTMAKETFTYYRKQFPLLSPYDIIRVDIKENNQQFFIIKEIKKNTLYIVDEIIPNNESFIMGSKGVEFNLRTLFKNIKGIFILDPESVNIKHENTNLSIREEHWKSVGWWWYENEALSSLFTDFIISPGENYSCTEILCLLENISEYHIHTIGSFGPFADMIISSPIYWRKRLQCSEDESDYMFYHYTHNISFYIDVLNTNLDLSAIAYRIPRNMSSPVEIPIMRFGKNINIIYIGILRTGEIVSFIEKPSSYLIETGAIVTTKCIKLKDMKKEGKLTFSYD